MWKLNVFNTLLRMCAVKRISTQNAPERYFTFGKTSTRQSNEINMIETKLKFIYLVCSVVCAFTNAMASLLRWVQFKTGFWSHFENISRQQKKKKREMCNTRVTRRGRLFFSLPCFRFSA